MTLPYITRCVRYFPQMFPPFYCNITTRILPFSVG